MQFRSVTRNKSIALPKISKTIANKNINIISIKVFNNLLKDSKSFVNKKKSCHFLLHDTYLGI